MTGDPHMFTSLDEEVDCQEKIMIGDNSKGKVQGFGNGNIKCPLNLKCAICCFFELQFAIRWTIM
jgi:hypothetical protein